jgi:hypothetical protein
MKDASLLFLFAPALSFDIHTVRSLVGLDINEPPFLVANGIELRASGTAVGCSFHVVLL